MLQVPEQYAGQRVKCPGCQAILTAPASAAPAAAPRPAPTPAPAPAAAAMLRFSCPQCGIAMQARAENAGRPTRCPGCQTTFPIPGGGADQPKSPIRSESPAPSHPRPDEDKAKKYSLPGLAGNPMLRYVGLGAGALLLLIVGVIGARYLFGGKPAGIGQGQNKPPVLSDMALIPAEAEALFSLRVGELWKNELVQKGLKKAPPDATAELTKAEQDLGLSLADVERVTLVVKDSAINNAAQQNWWVVVRTSKPYDSKKILDKIERADPMTTVTDKTHQDVAYKGLMAPLNPVNGGIYFVHDQLLVIGTEAGVKTAIELGKAPKDAGSLAGARGLIEAGKTQLVLAGAVPASVTELARQQLDMKTPGNYQILFELQTVQILGTFSKNLELQISLGFPSEPKASQAQTALKGLNGLAAGILTAVPEPPDPLQKKALEQALNVLINLDIKVAGKEVSLKLPPIEVESVVNAAQ